jgi:hypothetical protein
MTNEKPILFSTPMVKAILDGRKTQTRRIVKSRHESGMFTVSTAKYEPDVYGYYHSRSIQSVDWDERTVDGKDVLCPYGEVGDILWVRETWVQLIHRDRSADYGYKADLKENANKIRWKPSIHMPRAACRLRLEITDIKAERLQDISWEDAVAEGCPGYRPTQDEPTHQFQRLWTKINGEESWQSNPWVWVISFHPLKNRHNGRE